ncbi:hypothetical protein MCAG_02889 [Micromonospora sp. ATCC 39149]|nr:hypothetical protein MCAG_02889 [Micromonospora sp. ATCC 39149]
MGLSVSVREQASTGAEVTFGPSTDPMDELSCYPWLRLAARLAVPASDKNNQHASEQEQAAAERGRHDD